MKQRQIFLRDILTILFKRKFLIVLFAILVFAAAFGVNYVWPPTYESVASIRLTRGREAVGTDTTVLKSQASIAMVQMTQHDVNSEIEMIRSRNVLQKVAEGIDMSPKETSALRALYRKIKRAYVEALYYLRLKARPTPMQAAVELLSDAIEIEPVRDSFVLEIKCRLGAPDAAHAVLARLLDVYKEERVALFANKESFPFFVEQLARVRESLTEAQQKLRAFRQESQVTSLDVERQLLLEEYTELKRLLVQLAETEEVSKVVSEEAADAAIIAALSRQTNSPVVTEMQMRLLELLNDRNRMDENLGPKHPSIVAVNSQIVEAKARLDEAIKTTRQVAELKAERAEGRLLELNQLMAELENLEREVEIQATALESYAEKVEESRIKDAMAKAQISNVRVASTPTLPVDPVRPRKLLNLVFGLVAGIVGGLALAFFFDYLDHGIKTPEDIECYLEIPTLASFFAAKGPLNKNEAERLGTVIEVLNTETPTRFIEVTSSVGGEGAQQVARALAEAYSSEGQVSTLFIDFVGGATAGKMAPAASKAGMVDVLLGEAELDDALTTDGNLTVLGRGSHTEYPPNLWSSDAMQSLVTQLRGRFNYLVFHVGPVLQTPETLRLARLSDGIVLVIRADSTRREVVARGLEMLGDAKGVVIGAVLTGREQVIPKAIYRRI